MEDTTSRTEKAFIDGGCGHAIRGDGRGPVDCRSMTAELDVLPQCNSSCRLSIGTGTDLLCSVKLEVAEPSPLAPAEGILEVSAEFSPVVNLKMDKRKLQDEGGRIAQQLQDILLSSGAIDLSKLCIIPGKLCWVLHVDILYFQLDGCAVDAASYAVYAALHTARYPKTELLDGESGLPEDFELSSDLALACGLPLAAAGVPICVSVAEIGDTMIVDCDSAEMVCAKSLVSISFDKNESCCGLRKEAGNNFLTLAQINSATKVAGSLAKSIFTNLDAILLSSERTKKAHMLHPEVTVSSLGLLA
jgi:exosome complex component RRP42